MISKNLKRKLLLIIAFATSIIYIIWRIFFTIPFGMGITSLIFGLLLLITEITGLIEAIIHFYNMSDIVYPIKPDVDKSSYPDVDIFIATYNESTTLLYKTINGCLNMEYPDKSKVHIYLCDDSNRSEMKTLAETMKINYVTRQERVNAKAGNLNNAMLHSNSPLIVTFDADMIPMHDFLTTCIPYFITDEKIGFIQIPQSFYNPDLFQFNLFSENRIPNEQDYFYLDIQVSRNKTNSVIYGGSNTVISREALNDAGGFYTGVITEDFATGIVIQSKGYKCYALDEIHACGLSPSDLKSLIKQRQRWARGCIQSGKKLNILFNRGLNLKQKLSYISAISYWYSGIKRIIYILSPILFSSFGIVIVKCTLWQILIFWLPMQLSTNAALKILSNNIRNIKWTNIYETILAPSIILSVLLETFGISQKKFAVTKKDNNIEDDKKYRFKQSIPHIILALFSLIGIIKCILIIFQSGSINSIVLLYWLLINFYNVIMAIFFMIGRKSKRKHERFLASVNCIISYHDKQINCKTLDISEGGVSVILDFPSYIPYDEFCTITLNNKRYSCKFEAQIIQVLQVDEYFKYSFLLTKIQQKDKSSFFQIIYDRIPVFPRNLDKNISSYDDIRINIINRIKNYNNYSRLLPHIYLDKKLQTLECGQVTLTEFNYQYATITLNKRKSNIITINLSNDIILKCICIKNLTDKQSLYQVQNYKVIAENNKFQMILKKWIYNNKDNINLSKSYYKENRGLPYDEFEEMPYL